MTIELLENYIHQLIINQFPSQFIDCYFDPQFIDDVTTQLIFEVIKLDFDAQMDAVATSLRQHRKGIDKVLEDAEKQSDHRMIEYVQYYRDVQAKRMQENHGYAPEELQDGSYDSIDEKLSGHNVTPMQYEEMQNMKNIRLLKKVTGRQICSVKKISNALFKELYDEYDAHIDRLFSSVKDDASIIKNTLSFFTLEWKYSLEWAYKVADSIETGAFSKDRIEFAKMLCVPINGTSPDSVFCTTVSGENRLYLVRDRYFQVFGNPNTTGRELDMKHLQYYYTFAAVAFFKVNYKKELTDIMLQISSSDKAAFLKTRYWLWDKRCQKEWTYKKIKLARDFFSLILYNTPSPKIK